MEYKNIDKEIYHRNEIRRSIRPQYWVLFSLVVGVVGVVIFLTNNESALALGLMIWGGFALITWLCYLLFGDSRAPYHKPSKHLLSREYFYYPTSSLNQLTAALEAHDENRLMSVKRTAIPQLVLVRYSDDAEQVLYTQIKQVEGNAENPITNIYTNQK